MRKILSCILCILAVTVCLSFCGCNEKSQPTNSTNNSGEEMTIEGLCIVEKGGNVLIYSEKHGVIKLSNGTNDTKVFSSLSSGDKISVKCGLIAETYPAQTTISSLEVVEEGDAKDIPEEIIESLSDLGWEIVE